MCGSEPSMPSTRMFGKMQASEQVLFSITARTKKTIKKPKNKCYLIVYWSKFYSDAVYECKFFYEIKFVCVFLNCTILAFHSTSLEIEKFTLF